MGLKKADPSRLRDLLPKKDRAVDQEALKSCLQKLRSFRYQMRSSLGGDNLDTPEELALKGIVPNGSLGFGLSLEHRRNGSISLTSEHSGDGKGSGEGAKMGMGELNEAFEVPKEFANAIERLDSQQVKRIVELMGQCVQVQRSAHDVLKHANHTQEALKSAIMDKVRQMGLPLSGGGDGAATGGTCLSAAVASGETVPPRSAAPRIIGGARPTVYVMAGGANGWSRSSTKPVSATARETDENGESSSPGTSDLSRPRKSDAATSVTSISSEPPASAAQLVVGVPRSSSQTKQPLPSRMVSQGSVNLYSFVSARNSIPPSSSASPSADVRVGVGRSSNVAASSIGPLRATAAASLSPPPAPPPPNPPNQATGQATELGSAGQLEPARETSNITSNLFDHVDWEAGALLGGQEELDETTLRMEMKTSMDIHRLMRSRQKNQLRLHPQQQQQQLQQQRRSDEQGLGSSSSSWGSSEAVGGNGKGKGKGKAFEGAGVSLPSICTSASRSLGSKPGMPNAIGQQDAAFTGAEGGSEAGSGGQEGGEGGSEAGAEGSEAGAESSEAGAAVGAMNASDYNFLSWAGDGAATGSAVRLVPVPPPTSGGQDSEQQASVDASSTVDSGDTLGTAVSTGLTSDMVATDWNWEDDALDAQLFSFLLEGPVSG